MMGKLMLGPPGRITANAFVAADARRPLTPVGFVSGTEHAILWHRGSIAETMGLSIPAGSLGPDFWEGEQGWGSPGSLARMPRVLMIFAPQATGSVVLIEDVQAWVDSVYESVLRPLRVSVLVIGNPGSFNILNGVPIAAVDTVNQTGTFKTPLSVPVMVDPVLFRGGQLMVATITNYRTALSSGLDGTGYIDDYFGTGTNGSDPAFPGYDQFFDSSDPTDQSKGFTVFTVDAADHVAKLQAAIEKFSRFKSVFYHTNAEIESRIPGAEDSSIVPDSAIESLIAGEPSLSRVQYGSPSALFAMIAADALAFFA